SRTAGEGGRGRSLRSGEGIWIARPSPSHACGVGPSLSRSAGEGIIGCRRSLYRAVVGSLMLLTAIIGLAPPALAQRFGAESFTLANGLQVVVIPNHRAPAVTQMVWYKTGAADDPRGKSGIAHFLEHLMFKGTRANPGSAFSTLIAQNGGRDNAFTTEDYTVFHETVANDRLDLVMRLEADRMTGLVLDDAAVLPDRDVI